MIKQKMEDRAWQLHDQMQQDAQIKYAKKIMDWEKCDFETAWNICLHGSAEYRLGFKMSDPLFMIAMNAQLRKSEREAAKKNFEETLEPDELDLFKKEVEPMQLRDLWKKEEKKQKKTKIL